MHETHELAVMCDTFYPLKLSKFAKELDDGKYAYSWYEASKDGGAPEEAAVEEDATGAGLTSHF
jgi:homogentisate 1,2-dioxygenase